MKRAGCLAVALAAVVFLGVAMACDDHVGKCELEAWRAMRPAAGMLPIDGSATCAEGSINIRLYDDGKFIGTASGIIQGHALTAFSQNIQVAPKALTIKYSIVPD